MRNRGGSSQRFLDMIPTAVISGLAICRLSRQKNGRKM